GADRPSRFWSLLQAGIIAAGPLPPERGSPAMPVIGCFLPDVAGFDHGFFQLSPREAEALDPQARLLLEVAWEALEDAGQDTPGLAGREVGVFVGISNADYALAQFHSGVADRIGPYSYTGSAPSLTAGRIAHAFDFQGPALAVDTACSSSLLAVHLAAESLRTGDCTMALAGGVNLILASPGYASLGQLGALSPSGACRPFDDAADGYVRGEGCGVVVLKPLAAAQADGDPILAVVAASAANHDGRGSGLTVPSGRAQAQVIQRALRRAGADPATIDYLEAHGTGTPLGDPIEVRALDAVFSPRSAEAGKLPIGSVKGIIGHLESAAGIAGLIKAALVLRSGTIPPSPHLATPNRHLDWETLAVRVPHGGETLPRRDTPRRAGVSAFGFAGTNVHVVLEEAPAVAACSALAPPEGQAGLMPLSAASPAALRALAQRWQAYALANPTVSPHVIAATTALRRSHLGHRAALRFANGEQLVRQLRALATGEPAEGLAMGRRRPDRLPALGFVYTGQGAQWAGMGAALIRREPVFRAAIEACDALIEPLAGWSVAALLQQPDSSVEIARTDRAQAAIFAVQYGLTELLAHWGVVANCVVGHSCGEVAALHAAGMLSLAQACRVVTERGRLMQMAAGRGAMLAVAGSPTDVAPLLSDQVEIAAVNSPLGLVLAAPAIEVAALTRALEVRSISWQRLPVDFAFHSRQMAPAAVALAGGLADLSVAAARLPFYSTVLGRRADAADIDQAYWQGNVRGTVRFADAVAAMRRDETTHFLEIGPHPALQRSLAECLEGTDGAAPPITTLRRGQGQDALTQTLAVLYAEGFDLRWDRLCAPPPVLADVPRYPWQRTRFWQPGFDPWSDLPTSSAATVETRPEPGLYDVRWHEIAAPQSGSGTSHRLLVLADPTDVVAADIARGLSATLDTGSGGLAACLAGALPPTDVLMMPGGPMGDADPPTVQRAGLRFVLTALNAAVAKPPRFWLVTRGGQAPTDTAGEQLGADMLWALLRSAATEYPELGCRRIDLSSHPGAEEIALLNRVLAAPGLSAPDLAIRRSDVATTLYAAQLDRSSRAPAARALRVTRDGTYLVTGGCGSLGLLFARFLLAHGARNLILLGRGGESPAARAALASLTAGGARVLIRRADVTDEAALRGVLAEIDRDMPPLAGVVHAAGVLEDGMLAGLDSADPLGGAFDRVLAPKLDGGWVLHRVTVDRALDFMWLLSSASLLLGSPGQGAYAAANGFLDALARYRSGLGMPTLSLRLGVVAGSTMSRRAVAAGRDVAADGVFPLTEAEVAAAIPELWESGQPAATLMAFRAEDWLRGMPNEMARAWFAPLLPNQAGAAAVAASQVVSAAPWGFGQRAVTALRGELTTIVAGVTGLNPADIADDRPLRELGVDSLMTLKIRGEIVRRTGCEVRITAFWAHPTIGTFARHLAGELGVLAAAEPAPVAPERAEPADKWEKYL
ncbi:type I polyketide synthase, partial [Acidisphaera sp. S103]|uniref:type I polyketide synthase n=1 Tax=Acidisphaera sp. S103 TaxID=1747223 RepID=UPI00131A65E9